MTNITQDSILPQYLVASETLGHLSATLWPAPSLPGRPPGSASVGKLGNHRGRGSFGRSLLGITSCAAGKPVVDIESESENSLMTMSFRELAQGLRDVRNTKTTHGSPLTRDSFPASQKSYTCWCACRSCASLVKCIAKVFRGCHCQREISGSFVCEGSCS